MIKFILHGGVTSPRTEKNKEYFQRVIQEWWKKVLIFPFAQKDRNYDLQFEVDKKKFEEHNLDMQLDIVQASEDIEVLVQQIKEAEVLYFCGGITKYHTDIISQISNIRELIENKVITWNSAWSLMWSNLYYTGDFNEVRKWLWLLNIKMICHWQSEKYNNYDEFWLKKLEEYWEKLPIVCIREQEWVEFVV